MDDTPPPVRFHYPSECKINSLKSLGKRLSITVDDLIKLSENSDNLYQSKSIPKKSGGARTVYNPDKRLKSIQRKINSRIFSNITFPIFLQGSIADEKHKRDYIRCAQQHCGAGIIATEDIENFFDNIDDDTVHNIFKNFMGMELRVAEVLTNLTTLHGTVPQGAPTSSYLANLVFYDEEVSIYNYCAKGNVTYTRLVDDITISHRDRSCDIQRFSRKIKGMITNKNLSINLDKQCEVKRSSSPLMVHSIKVNDSSPTLKRDEVRIIRASVHNLSKKVKDNHHVRVTFGYHQLHNSISGKINKLSRVKHATYHKLRTQLRRILPLPSNKFKLNVGKKLNFLESVIEEKRSEPWYSKEVNRLEYRLGILGRSYPELACAYRKRTKPLKSDNE